MVKFMVRWSATKLGWGTQLLVAGCLLLAGTAGCGSSAADKPAKAESRAGNGKTEDRTSALQPRDGKSGQNGPLATAATGSVVARPLDDDDRLDIPKDVAKDLSSSDARDRYRALEYWEKKGSTAPMDPVFDAVEDDDPAVRAKAEAIIGKYLESEEKQE